MFLGKCPTIEGISCLLPPTHFKNGATKSLVFAIFCQMDKYNPILSPILQKYKLSPNNSAFCHKLCERATISVSQSTYHKLEAEQIRLTVERAKELADLYEIDPEYFYTSEARAIYFNSGEGYNAGIGSIEKKRHRIVRVAAGGIGTIGKRAGKAGRFGRKTAGHAKRAIRRLTVSINRSECVCQLVDLFGKSPFGG